MKREIDDPETSGTKFRQLSGYEKWTASFLLLALSTLGALWALELQYYLPIALFSEQFYGVALGVGLAATFLYTRASSGESGESIPWYDWLLALASLAVGGYIAIWYPEILYSLSDTSPLRYMLGALAIVLTFEATRRLLGWTLIILTAAFILYARFADLFPGVLNGQPVSWERMLTYIFLDTNGILGVTLAVTITVVLAFILFGQALFAIHGDNFFTRIALALLGRHRGGPAKVAVLSSSLLGTVSGSVVSNVVISGTVTIPLMKRSGYSAPMAAAIEAVASTGGSIMPPVMGAAAFIMAEYLGVPYVEVALAAAIPAILYYICLILQVDLEAAKYGLAGLDAKDIPRASGVMRRGWIYLIPIAVLIYTLLVARWAPGKAGMWAAISCFVAGAIYRENRVGWRGIVACLRDAGPTLLPLIAISAIAGVVIGALQLSGLTFKLALVLGSASSGQTFVMLLLTAVVCIILGLGMPTTVIYVMLAVLVAPALIELGVQPMAAHLFIFYFGMMSMITPPVCMGTYTAATIANANFWKAGGYGMRLGIVAFIVPFVFVFHPALILEGSVTDIIVTSITAVIAVCIFAIVAAGYLFSSLSIAERVVFGAAALMLIWPATNETLMVLNAVALLLAIFMAIRNHRAANKSTNRKVHTALP